jgi:hypothetical protein
MQSILLHIQDDDDLDGRIDAAVILAHAFDGYISCLHTTPYGVYLTNDPFTAMMLPVDFSSKMEQLALDLRLKVEERLRNSIAEWEWTHVDDEAHLALLRRAPIADVVVLKPWIGPEGAVARCEGRSDGARAGVGGTAIRQAVRSCRYRGHRMGWLCGVFGGAACVAAAAAQGRIGPSHRD